MVSNSAPPAPPAAPPPADTRGHSQTSGHQRPGPCAREKRDGGQVAPPNLRDHSLGFRQSQRLLDGGNPVPQEESEKDAGNGAGRHAIGGHSIRPGGLCHRLSDVLHRDS